MDRIGGLRVSTDNPISLAASALALKADLGIAFDGDADRIGAVDSKGRVIWGDQLLIILAGALLLERFSGLRFHKWAFPMLTEAQRSL